jgi:hypothetical protein
MLLPAKYINTILIENNIDITGIFHLGAHDCEELQLYNELGVNDIIWVDAMANKVNEAKQKRISNIYEAVISDTDDTDVIFNVSNNVQSSSILELGTHLIEHPNVIYVDKFHKKTITVDTFFERNNIDASKYNFWNFDIQGAELLALKGAIKSIKYAKILYLEVNVKELYIGCPLIEEIDDFLKEYDFKRVVATITSHGWGDAIYIKNNH